MTHPVYGTVVFACGLTLGVQAIFAWSAPFMDAIDGAVGWVGEMVGALLPEGLIQSLVVG